jgi:surface antigen
MSFLWFLLQLWLKLSRVAIMRASSAALRSLSMLLSCGLLATLLVGIGASAPRTTDVDRSSAGTTYLCWGYAGCRDRGYGDGGYGAVNGRSYWNMYPGHNCTNYVAYRMIQAGMSNTRPFGFPGNATNWGEHMAHMVDSTPHPMAVAWWRANDGGHGSAGHVAIVERVAADHIIISEDSWGGTFTWRRINRTSSRWPTGFIHFVSRVIENVQQPRLQGEARFGEVLRVTDGTWNTDVGSYRYRWFVDGVRQPGDRDPTFRLGAEHIGKQVRVRVVAVKSGWTTGSQMTVRSAPIAPAQFGADRGPSISGVPTRGEELVLRFGLVTPAPQRTRVQWFADGKPIPGATTRRLTLTQDHVRARITATVTRQRASYEDLVMTTEATDWVRNGYVVSRGDGRIDGSATVSSTLQAVPSRTGPSTAKVTGYQWLRDGVPIAGATGQTYLVRAADFRSRIGVAITYDHSNRMPLTETIAMTNTVRARTAMTTGTEVRGQHGRLVVFSVAVVARHQIDATVSGEIVVRMAGRTERVALENGEARIVLRGVPYGSHDAVVRQLANDEFLGSTATVRVDVVRP